jgi:hypothetical protein
MRVFPRLLKRARYPTHLIVFYFIALIILIRNKIVFTSRLVIFQSRVPKRFEVSAIYNPLTAHIIFILSPVVKTAESS